jgi:hypothetical protein
MRERRASHIIVITLVGGHVNLPTMTVVVSSGVRPAAIRHRRRSSSCIFPVAPLLCQPSAT